MLSESRSAYIEAMEKKHVALTSVATLALVLAACGAPTEDKTSESTQDAQQTQTQQTETQQAQNTDADDADDADDKDSADNNAQAPTKGGSQQNALKAIETAEKEVGGKVVDLDWDDDKSGWSVDVVKGNKSHELEVAADGSKVTNQDEVEDVDSDDRREYDAIKVEIAKAIETALKDTPGTLDDVSVDEEQGQIMWEVDIYPEGGGADLTVYVDVKSGQVLKKDK